MRSVEVLKVDAFTNRPYRGNPAGVVLDAEDLGDGEMLQLARELNTSETAFVFPSRKADLRIRFFAPSGEIPLCGHATVAAFHALAEEGLVPIREGVNRFRQETGAGVLGVEVTVTEGRVERVSMEQRPPRLLSTEVDTGRMARLLGTESRHLAGPPCAVSTGLPVLLVGLKSLKKLSSLRPDMAGLKVLCKGEGLAGVHCFTTETLSPEARVHARFFAPALGIPEDPVTGTANGALGAYLAGGRDLEMACEQGYSVGRPGLVFVEVRARGGRMRVRVGGSAVTVLRGDMLVG